MSKIVPRPERPRVPLKAMLMNIMKAGLALSAGIAAAAAFNLIVRFGPWLIDPPAPCPPGAICIPTPASMVMVAALSALIYGLLIALFFAPAWKILRRAGGRGPLSAGLLGAGLTLVIWTVLNGWPADMTAVGASLQYSLSGAAGALTAWWVERRMTASRG
jgi:hypothetical protein